VKIISHRGNLEGKNEYENYPEQIEKALSHDIDCEIDLWLKQNRLYLGHDSPDVMISKSFLKTPGLWIHAKNLEAVEWLSKTNLHWFWHEEDKLTITSKGVIWCYPNVYVQGGVTVIKSIDNLNPDIKSLCKGICTDYPLKARLL
tara:strand:- start:5562 stop:5996 length:435 start_codon:yes stop_codon:yes gene_type:complete